MKIGPKFDSSMAPKFASSSAKYADPDMNLLNDLFTEIEARPPAIEARKLLVQQCLAAGWNDTARDAVEQILRLAPEDYQAKAWAISLADLDPEGIPSSSGKAPEAMSSWPVIPEDIEDTEMARIKLLQGYEKLQLDSKRLQHELGFLQSIINGREPPSSSEVLISKRLDSHLGNLAKLSSGRVSSALRVQQLRSARSVARDMESNPGKAVDLLITDLRDYAQWLQSSSQRTQIDGDELREALVKRVRIVNTGLVDDTLKALAVVAQMHAEHEVLKRTYVNDETMYGDAVVDIPRENFLVTDDGYAWDMEELAQAITSNNGVMRNPLSKQMFTTNDIRAIVQHPLGTGLRALQVEQDKLSKGVRPETIEEMEKMALILLADMSDDQMASRQVVDAFMAYVATLPDLEIKALEGLRVPAKDSHTGQAFDCSIFEAVKDAQGNRVCFHKTGDFLQQAAKHLRSI